MSVKVGMIGVGGVGELLLKTFIESNLTSVVGIHDKNAERLNVLKDKYGVEIYDNAEKLLENEEVELVYIGVPPKFHHSIALEVMKAGKHVLCEKPLANSVEEAQELAEESQKRNQVYAMNFPTTYRRAFMEMERKVVDGDLGDIRKVEVQCYFKEWPRSWQQNAWINSREQGGFVKEVFPHFIQMIQRLFGNFELIHSWVEYPEDEQLCETGVVAIGRIERNRVPILLNGASALGQEEYLHFTVYGTEQTVSLVNWRDLWVTTKSGKEKIELTEVNQLEQLVENVVNAIKGEPATIVTFNQGYEVQKVLEAIANGI
jgi:predicted dehydrogenase